MERQTGLEAVGQILPRLIDHSRMKSRKNSACSKSVNVLSRDTTPKPMPVKPSASSIADLRCMLQKLGVTEILPDEQVYYHASQIETAYQGHIACKTCRKEENPALSCTRTGVRCQDGKLYFFFETCPHATSSHLASLREKLHALGIHEEVDDAALEEHCVDIEDAERSARRCASCDKQDESVLSCICTKLGFEDGELNLRCGPCPRSRQVKERLEQERRARDQMEQLVISKRFRNRRFQNFRLFGKAADTCRLVKKWADEWADERGTGLLLHGQAGNGKTHLAVAAMMEVHERFGVPAVFDVLPSFQNCIRRPERPYNRRRTHFAIKRYASAYTPASEGILERIEKG